MIPPPQLLVTNLLLMYLKITLTLFFLLVTASHWTLTVSCFSARVSSGENDPEDHL